MCPYIINSGEDLPGLCDFYSIQVNGIGACGLYRLPRTKEEEEQEVKEEKKIKKEKEEKDAIKKSTDSEVMKEGDETEKNDSTVSDMKDNTIQQTSSAPVSNDTNDVKSTEKKKKAKAKKKHAKAKSKYFSVYKIHSVAIYYVLWTCLPGQVV